MASTRKKHPSLQRRVRYSSDEIYSRYLGVSLPVSKGHQFCEGRFGKFLKNRLGVKKIPYNINLLELISSGCITPKLTIELPCSYFENWTNFPYCPRQGSEDEHDEIIGLYSYEAVPFHNDDLKDIIHPYDGDLKNEFVERYRKDFPLENTTYQHPNGRRYKAEEVYFSYWQGLALASSIHKINNINLHLPLEKGVEKTKEIIKCTIEDFCDLYGDSFERVSWYRTATAVGQHSKIIYSYKEVVEELSKYREVDRDILIGDLKNLLCLYKKWNDILDNFGCVVIGKAIEVLRKDIYLVFEQLCILGDDKDLLFEKFNYGRCPREWAKLSEALYFEEYSLKNFFEVTLDNYCSRVKAWGYECTPEVFDYFSKIDGFYPWIRSLHDLHENMRWNGEVNFSQPRIVDCLIIASVRTEIIIREMLRVSFEDLKGFDADSDFMRVLLSVGHQTKGGDGDVLKQVKSESSITKLNNRPDNIFLMIEETSYRGWSKKDIVSLRSVLKFVCVRNYFAHHAYKDESFDSATSDLASETLKSLVETLLFFHHICHERDMHVSGDQKA